MTRELAVAGRGLPRFFPYFGAKRQHAARYPEPRHPLIVEPFAGSAGYATLHYRCDVLLIDLDPAVVATWRYLIGASVSELLALPDVPLDGTVDDVRLTPEQRCLVGWWMAHGRAKPATKPSSWMVSGVRPLSYWGPGVRAKLAAQVPRIRHWRVVEGGYGCAPDVGATWFVDPPYVEAGRSYTRGSAGIDYDALAAWCRGRCGQVMVCEAAGATWLPFQPFGSLRASPGTGRRGRTDEVVWVSEGGRGEST